MKLELPDFELGDDMAANLANEELTAQVETLCTLWNRQIMDALDGLLRKSPEGKSNKIPALFPITLALPMNS